MARRRNNHNKRKIPAGLLVPFAVLLIFILFVSVSSFRDPLFNFLFPKPPTQAATGESVENGYGTFVSALFPNAVFPSANWRPYADSSPFNQPVPANPKIATNSAGVVSRWFQLQPGDPTNNRKPADMSVGLSTSNSIYKDYGHPIVYSHASDPVYTVHCNPPYWTGTCEVEGDKVAIPKGVKPANGTDLSLAVIDQSTDTEYDFWQVEDPSGWADGLDVSWGGKTNIRTGDGLGSDATAAWFGLAGGIVRAAEWANKNIDHALFIVIHCDNGQIVYPAGGHGSKCSDTTNAPPLGARFYLNMTDTEIQNTGLATWKQTLMKSMAHYGMYFGDTGGGADWYIQTESGFSYTPFNYDDPLVDFAKNNGASFYKDFWILKFPEMVNYADKIFMIDPCVTETGTADCSTSTSTSPTSTPIQPTPTFTLTPTPVSATLVILQGTLTVTDVSMSYTVQGPNRTVKTVVTVRDTVTGVAISGATVSLTTTLPSGKTYNYTATTNSAGKATFTTKSKETGAYLSKVTNVVKSGYTYSVTNTSGSLLVN